MVPEINIWAVLAATLSTMVVGFIWYARPVFGTWWMKTAKVVEGGSIAYPLVATLIVSFISSVVLAGAISIVYVFYGETNFLLDAVLTALIFWAGFTAARVITHDGFENRPKLLTLLTISHELVTFLVMGLVIGLFGYAGA
jgi:hypothetical protein